MSDTQNILDRIKAARAEPELVEPTDEAEAEIEAVETEEVVNEEPETEVVESSESDDVEDSVYLVGDKEISLKRLKELEEGHLRQSDYTRKTMELAEQRKVLESNSAKVAELSSRLEERLSELEKSLASEVESVDWDELADLDPSEYLKKKSAIEKKQTAISKAQEEKTKLLQAKASEEVKLLHSKMPEWSGEKGEAVRKADSDLALKFAAELGFTESDLNTNVDHRFYLALIKAAKYDALKKQSPEVKKKVAQAPKVTPANKVAKISQSQEALQRLRKTGSDKDALAALKMYLTR